LALYFRPTSHSAGAASTPNLAATQTQVLAAAEQQRCAVAKAQLRFLLDKGRSVLVHVDKLAKDVAAWDREIEALLNNDEGRLIAADPERVKMFTALHRSVPPLSSDEVGQQRARIQAMLEPLQQALDGVTTPFMPDDAIEEQLERELKPVVIHTRTLRELRHAINALLANARAAGDEPSDTTLQESINSVEQQYARMRADDLARAREAAEEESRQKLVTLEKRKLAELADAEHKRREAELEAQRTEQETQARLIEEKALGDRLRALAEDSEIQAKYQVFLAEGHYSFANNKVYNTTAFRPSYNALKRIGILSFLDRFTHAASGNNFRYSDSTWSGTRYFSQNDRPLWQTYPRTDAQWEWYKERFEEFRRLAPIWREMGLLSP